MAHRTGRRLTALLCGALGATASTGDATATSASTVSPPELSQSDVTIGGTYFGFFAPVWIAQEQGFFADEGLDVELQNIATSASDLVAALVGGSLDMAVVSPPAALEAAENGAPLQFVMTLNHGTENAIVIDREAATEAGVPEIGMEDQLEALRGSGLTLAFNSAGSSSYIELGALLANRGMTVGEDVEFTTTGGGQATIAAFRAGQVDGYGALPPDSIAVPEADRISIFLGEAPEYADAIYRPLSVLSSFVEDHPDTVQAVVNAVTRAWVYLQENPDEAAAALTPMFEESGITDPATISALIQSVVQRTTVTTAIRQESFDAVVALTDASREAPLTVTFDDMVDNNFANEAISAQGLDVPTGP